MPLAPLSFSPRETPLSTLDETSAPDGRSVRAAASSWPRSRVRTIVSATVAAPLSRSSKAILRRTPSVSPMVPRGKAKVGEAV